MWSAEGHRHPRRPTVLNGNKCVVISKECFKVVEAFEIAVNILRPGYCFTVLHKSCFNFTSAALHVTIDVSYFSASMLLCLSSFVHFSGPSLKISDWFDLF